MNVVRYANLNSRVNLAPLARIFGAISFFAFLGGCFSSTPTPSTPAPVISFTDLKNRVGQIRGLSLKRNITIEATTSNGDAGASDKTLTEMDGPTVVTQLARAYKRIGLLPENTDFAKALADYRRLFDDDPRPIKWVGFEAHSNDTRSRSTALFGAVNFQPR